MVRVWPVPRGCTLRLGHQGLSPITEAHPQRTVIGTALDQCELGLNSVPTEGASQKEAARSEEEQKGLFEKQMLQLWTAWFNGQSHCSCHQRISGSIPYQVHLPALQVPSHGCNQWMCSSLPSMFFSRSLPFLFPSTSSKNLYLDLL